MVGLIDGPLDPSRVVAAVHRPGHGGVASFLGVVRNQHAGRAVTRLEYSAYKAMAEAELTRIVEEARHRWRAEVSVVHRVGTLVVGDVAVAVAASTPHRAAAFDACRFVIEETKRRVPIWKKEFFADGTVSWVDPTVEGRSPGLQEPSQNA